MYFLCEKITEYRRYVHKSADHLLPNPLRNSGSVGADMCTCLFIRKSILKILHITTQQIPNSKSEEISPAVYRHIWQPIYTIDTCNILLNE